MREKGAITMGQWYAFCSFYGLPEPEVKVTKGTDMPLSTAHLDVYKKIAQKFPQKTAVVEAGHAHGAHDQAHAPAADGHAPPDAHHADAAHAPAGHKEEDDHKKDPNKPHDAKADPHAHGKEEKPADHDKKDKKDEKGKSDAAPHGEEKKDDKKKDDHSKDPKH